MNLDPSWKYMCHPAWRAQLVLLAFCLLLCCWGVVMSLGLVLGQVENYAQSANSLPGLVLVSIGWGPLLVATLVLLYRHYQWRYSIEDGAISSTKGIFGRHSRSINVEDVRNVNVNQSFVQRLLRIGDVEFSSAGGGGIEVVFEGVRSPGLIADAIQEERRSTSSRALKGD